MAVTPTVLDKVRVESFFAKMVEDTAAAFSGGLRYLGDRLGIYRCMAAAGPATLQELAGQTGLQERYLKEWLGAMVAGGVVEYDPATGQYTLPPEHAAVLADEESPYFLGAWCQMLVPVVTVAPRVAECFHQGGGVSQSEYSMEMYESMERESMPRYKHLLVQQWLPTMPDVVTKLSAGGRALDVGCGCGLASIALARAFPRSVFYGIDMHAESIERARANANEAGLADRVYFDIKDAVGLEEAGFDFITTFDVVHDSPDPQALLVAICRALAPGGTYLMLEMNASGKPEENISAYGELLYSISTLYCMTTSLALGGAGLGACLGEEKARELAEKAGFSRFRKLPVADPFSVLYELKR
jgi:2-polyprenyl-3-methyl-5-hydroxy-6-metoxy-1,4-benzoquinol methylase